MFDFRRMPLSDHNALECWSNDSIRWLVENKLPELDVEVVQNEALKVRMWLPDCQRKFMVQVPVYDENGDRVKGRTKEELALCGDN